MRVIFIAHSPIGRYGFAQNVLVRCDAEAGFVADNQPAPFRDGRTGGEVQIIIALIRIAFQPLQISIAKLPTCCLDRNSVWAWATFFKEKVFARSGRISSRSM